MRFVDTNVLLYAVGRSPAERTKSAAALALLEADDLVLSELRPRTPFGASRL